MGAAGIAVGLAAAQIWYWSRLFTTPGRLAHSDLYEYFLPAFLSPFVTWSSSEFAGMPVFADPQNATWYPVQLIARALGSWSIEVAAAYVIAGLGAAAYGWQITRSKTAAVLAGLAWPWSEALADLFPHLAMLHGFAWLPWLLFGLEKVADTGSWRWVGGTAIFLACVGLSGHIQVVVYCGYLSALYAVMLWAAGPHRRRTLLTIAATFALGGALCSIQSIPSAEASAWVARSDVSFAQFADAFAKKPHELMTVIIPQFCHERRESPSYVGLLTIFLAIVALTTRPKEWRVAFWGVIGIVCLLLGLGSLTPLAEYAYQLPVYDRFRVVARHLVLFSFAAIALAAFGVGALREGRLSWRRASSTVGVLLALTAGGLFFVAVHPALFDASCDGHGLGRFAESLTGPRVQGLLALLSGGLMLLTVPRRVRPIALALIPALLAVDLLSAQSESEQVDQHGYQVPTILPDTLLQPSVHAARLKSELAPTHQRVLSIEGNADPIVPGVFARLWSLPSLGGYNPLLPKRLARLAIMDANGGTRPKLLLNDDLTLDLFAVKYVVVRAEDLRPATVPGIDSGQALDVLVGPSDCRPRGPMSLTLSTAAMPVAGLELIGRLVCGDNVKEDQSPGTITVSGGGETRQAAFPRQGPYRMTFPPLAADTIRIDAAGMRGLLQVDRIGLVGTDGSIHPMTLWDPLESTCRHASLSIL